MTKTTYKFLENQEGVIKTEITQEVEIDLGNTLKNIRQTRAEFQKAWATLIEMAKAMKVYTEQHKVQNEFLKQVGEYLGENYILPELESKFNIEDLESDLKNFIEEEKNRRAENVVENMSENLSA